MNHTGVTSVGSERQALRNRLSGGAGGNRRLARLGGRDEHRVPLELDPVNGDRERRRPAQHLARLEREHALETGQVLGGPPSLPIAVYRVKLEGDTVLIAPAEAREPTVAPRSS